MAASGSSVMLLRIFGPQISMRSSVHINETFLSLKRGKVPEMDTDGCAGAAGGPEREGTRGLRFPAIWLDSQTKT